MPIRLVRYRWRQDHAERGLAARVGLQRDDGAVVDLVGAWAAAGHSQKPWGPDQQDPLLATLAAGIALAVTLRALRDDPPTDCVRGADAVQLTAPVIPATVVATGWNFPAHVEEARDRVGAVVPSTPTGFLKLPCTIVGPEDEVIRPGGEERLDYEVELAAVLCRRTFRVDRTSAEAAIGGYTLMNDVSARGVQEPEMKAGLLLAGKNFPTFGPFGPAIVPAWDFDMEAARLLARVNGEARQDAFATTATRDLTELIAYWTTIFPLAAGDVVTLGSPPGVAYGGSEAYLRPGDVIELEEAQIGVLRNRVVEAHVTGADAASGKW